MADVIAGDQDRAKAKEIYQDVKTQADWEALTPTERSEDIRQFMKWWLQEKFIEDE